ncbi:Peptidyl-prolyl cis-trans isomerase [Actinidia chinensis var. chinensis]|uniref:peptidylprolyl isomerase n=1 Tax=Actinidia chinensis var. chinensis TaxID=1590841 RepID=A0A2R6PM20_ACTCC|nr:Peptidyl-prolyl cis-trans isomerase [Actinidia chinensis var. chinensis]
MAFWGTEVKPGRPYSYADEMGRLHLSQATLGSGSSTKKSILLCMARDEKPIYLCSLFPEKFETCQLNHEFEQEVEIVFSVVGPNSIHLSGYWIRESSDSVGDACGHDSYGEDIAETESDESTDYDTEDEYDSDFIDDDLDMYPPSPIPNSGVVIEEILDDEKPANENGISKRVKKKKNRLSTSDDNGNSEQQLVKNDTGGPILESEDEDGFPISSRPKNKADALSINEKVEEIKDKGTNDESKKKKAKGDHPGRDGSLKRKVGDIIQDGEQTSDRETGQRIDFSLANTEEVPETDIKQQKKNKKKKVRGKEETTRDVGADSRSINQSEAAAMNMENNLSVGKEDDQKLTTDKNLDIDAGSVVEEKKKKKKKKSKKQGNDVDVNVDQNVTDKNGSTEEITEKTEAKPFQARTFPNGLVIEELAMGKPDGKKASPGKKVSVHYIGRLKKNDKIFDSNIGRAPFKFRLGIGQVIKGWDVGVNGMRVGDKRRLTIPPAMGYGAQGAGGAIPPNSWLVFDVELVDVR